MQKINYQKNDISKELSKATGYSLLFSKKLINDLIECIIKNIYDSNLNLKNFGSFKAIFKKQRIGRNPKTKIEFLIKSRKSLKFTPSKKLSNYINDNL